MKSMTGIDIVEVPYKGITDVMTDLMSSRIEMFFVGTQIAAQQVQAGKLRALAVTGAKRWKGLPEVPTMQEQGFKDYNLINWFGLWLPANAPPAIVARLHAETCLTRGAPHRRGPRGPRAVLRWFLSSPPAASRCPSRWRRRAP